MFVLADAMTCYSCLMFAARARYIVVLCLMCYLACAMFHVLSLMSHVLSPISNVLSLMCCANGLANDLSSLLNAVRAHLLDIVCGRVLLCGCVFVWAAVGTDASLCVLVATALFVWTRCNWSRVPQFSDFVSFVLVFVRARVALHYRMHFPMFLSRNGAGARPPDGCNGIQV